MKWSVGMMVLVVGTSGCFDLLGSGCEGQETVTAEFLLPVRLPIVDDWTWDLDGGLPLGVHDPLLPWPGVELNSIAIERERGDFVILREDYAGGVHLSYGTRDPATGQSPTERRWLEDFAANAMNVTPQQLAPILDEYGEIRQAGGPPQFHEARFAADLLDLDKYWNTTRPSFSEIGLDSGWEGECIGTICYRGSGTMWSFGWVHNADWSQTGKVSQVAVRGGTAITLDGPLVSMTPWGAGQVLMPGNDTGEARRYAEQWIELKGLPTATSIETKTWGCAKGSDWPATQDVADLNADAPYMGEASVPPGV